MPLPPDTVRDSINDIKHCTDSPAE